MSARCNPAVPYVLYSPASFHFFCGRFPGTEPPGVPTFYRILKAEHFPNCSLFTQNIQTTGTSTPIADCWLAISTQ
jgi:hypothetical protein